MSAARLTRTVNGRMSYTEDATVGNCDVVALVATDVCGNQRSTA